MCYSHDRLLCRTSEKFWRRLYRGIQQHREAQRLRRLVEGRCWSTGARAMFALHDFWAAWARTDGYGKIELCERMLR